MAYWNFKDLARRTASDKVLRDKGFSITKNPEYDGYQRVLTSMVYKYFVNNEIKQNDKLAEELHKPIIKKKNKRDFILHLKTIFGVLIWLIWN